MVFRRFPAAPVLVFSVLSMLGAGPARAQDEAVAPVPPPPATDAVPPPPATDTVPPPPPQAQTNPVGPATQPITSAQMLDEGLRLEPNPVLRLEGWLQRNGERAETARVASAVLSLVVAAACITGAVWAYQIDDLDARTLTGALFVGLGAMNAAMGVAMLEITTPQEDRLRRWQEARRRGATAVDVAAFEGEFRTENELAKFQRIVGGVVGLAFAVGGGAMIALTAADRDLGDEEALVGYSLGGTFLLTGALVGLISLAVRTPVEQDWDNYQRGATPSDPSATGIF